MHATAYLGEQKQYISTQGDIYNVSIYEENAGGGNYNVWINVGIISGTGGNLQPITSYANLTGISGPGAITIPTAPTPTSGFGYTATAINDTTVFVAIATNKTFQWGANILQSGTSLRFAYVHGANGSGAPSISNPETVISLLKQDVVSQLNLGEVYSLPSWITSSNSVVINIGNYGNGVTDVPIANGTNLDTIPASYHASAPGGIFERDTLQVKLLNIPLPLEVKKLRGTVVATGIKLDWIIEDLSEEGLHEVVIEKSLDTRNWIPLTSSSEVEATVIDMKPYEGHNYYRLVIKDLEGGVLYSDIITVMYSLTNTETVLYPNPTNDFLFLTRETKLVTVSDVTGTPLLSQRNTACIDVRYLRPGAYIVNVDGTSKTFIKQ